MREPVVYIDTHKAARRAIEELHAAGDVPVAVDTEFEADGTPTLMSYSWKRGVRRVVLGSLVSEHYGAWLTSPTTKLVYQNYKADAEAFDMLGLDTRPSFHADIMIMGWLVDETLLRHGLKQQALHFLSWRRQEYAQLFSYVPAGKKREVVMSPREVMFDPPPDALAAKPAAVWRQTMLDYSGDDAESTLALYWHHREHLQAIGYWQNYLKIDRPYTLTLMACEDRGVSLDVPRLREILRSVDRSAMRAVHAFRSAAGKPDLNLNSIPQLQKLLIEEWGWPVRDDLRTKKGGAPQLNREALEWWADEHGYELAKVKLEYNNAVKLRGTFLEGLIGGINDDGRLRSDFNQIGADTGRISSRKRVISEEYEVTLKNGETRQRVRKVKIGANLQNIPARKEKDPYGIRAAFRAAPVGMMTAWDAVATEPHVLVVCDYSGFELCMAIHWVSTILDDSPMLQIMQKYGSPSAVHAFTAIRLYADAKDEHGNVLGKIHMDDWRTVKKLFPSHYAIAKNNNFNLLYGGSAKMMARLRGMDHNDPDVLAECQEQIDAWNTLYSEIGLYQRHMIAHGDEHGWVPTISGRHAHVGRLLQGCRPDGREAADMQEARKWRSFGERKCMNTPCQGSAADIVKVAMNYIERDAELRELGAALLFPVHDELVLECPQRHADRVLERTIDLMRKPFRSLMKFQIDVEGHYGTNWQEAKG